MMSLYNFEKENTNKETVEGAKREQNFEEN